MSPRPDAAIPFAPARPAADSASPEARAASRFARPRHNSRLRPHAPGLQSYTTGLIGPILDSPLIKSDPDLFCVTAITADVTAYGARHKVASNGNGAGLTYQNAYNAAVGECVERYAFGVMHPEDLLFGTYTDLKAQGENPIAPGSLPLFDDSQIAQSFASPFEADTRLAWTRGENLMRREDCLIPASLIYMPYKKQYEEEGEQLLWYALSTGGACARSRPEAVLKSIYEIVERDNFMIMWRNQLPCPRVVIDPESPFYATFTERFARPGLVYNLIETTMDMGVTSIFGTLTDTRRDPPAILAGGATHPNPEVAVLKTLLELVQGLKWIDHMARSGETEFERLPDFRNILTFEDRVRLYAFNDMRESFGFLWNHANEKPLSSMPSQDKGSVQANLSFILGELERLGLEALAVDLTTVDTEACNHYVTKLLIPGVEGLEANFLYPFLGGKRWREVPRKLGWLLHEPGLADINPYPHPYP